MEEVVNFRSAFIDEFRGGHPELSDRIYVLEIRHHILGQAGKLGNRSLLGDFRFILESWMKIWIIILVGGWSLVDGILEISSHFLLGLWICIEKI